MSEEKTQKYQRNQYEIAINTNLKKVYFHDNILLNQTLFSTRKTTIKNNKNILLKDNTVYIRICNLRLCLTLQFQSVSCVLYTFVVQLQQKNSACFLGDGLQRQEYIELYRKIKNRCGLCGRLSGHIYCSSYYCSQTN